MMQCPFPTVSHAATQVQRLVEAGRAYPCFCSDEELAAMKADAEARNLPPVYRGRWARASAAEVDAELAKARCLTRLGGKPHGTRPACGAAAWWP